MYATYVIYGIVYIIICFYIYNAQNLYQYFANNVKANTVRTQCGKETMETDTFRYQLLGHFTSESTVLIYYIIYVIIVVLLILQVCYQNFRSIATLFNEGIKDISDYDVSTLEQLFLGLILFGTVGILVDKLTKISLEDLMTTSILSAHGINNTVFLIAVFVVAVFAFVMLISSIFLMNNPKLRIILITISVLLFYAGLYIIYIIPYIYEYDKSQNIDSEEKKQQGSKKNLDELKSLNIYLLVGGLYIVTAIGSMMFFSTNLLYSFVMFFGIVFITNIILMAVHFGYKSLDVMEFEGLFGFNYKTDQEKFKIFLNILTVMVFIFAYYLVLYRDENDFIKKISFIIISAIIVEVLFGVTHILQKFLYDFTDYSLDYKSRLFKLNAYISMIISKTEKEIDGNHSITGKVKKIEGFATNMEFVQSTFDYDMNERINEKFGDYFTGEEEEYVRYLRVVYNQQKQILYDYILRSTEYYGYYDVTMKTLSYENKVNPPLDKNEFELIINEDAGIKNIREELNEYINSPNGKGKDIAIPNGSIDFESFIKYNYNTTVSKNDKMSKYDSLTVIELEDDVSNELYTIRFIGMSEDMKRKIEMETDLMKRKEVILQIVPASMYPAAYLYYYNNDMDKFMGKMRNVSKMLESIISKEDVRNISLMVSRLKDADKYIDSSLYTLYLFIMIIILLIIMFKGFDVLDKNENYDIRSIQLIMVFITIMIYLVMAMIEVLIKKL